MPNPHSIIKPMTCVINVEGVLQQMVGGEPLRAGVQLYHALAVEYNLVLSTTQDHAKVTEWLHASNINKQAYLEAHGGAETVKLRGYPVALAVTADMAEARDLFLSGIPVLVFAHPQYAQPEHRPDYKWEPRQWDTLAAETTKELLRAAADDRLMET